MLLFDNRPETPLRETIQFMTDVIEHRDGTEQRVCLRDAPRTLYGFDVIVEDGPERARLENKLFSQADGLFLLPAWAEGAYLDADAAGASTSLSFDPAYCNWSGRVLLVSPDGAVELLEGVAVGGAGATLAEPLAALWPAGTEVFPVREALLAEDPRVQRWTSSAAKYSFNFRIIDQAPSLAGESLPYDALGIGLDADLLVVDDANAVSGDTIGEAWSRSIRITDGDTGAFQAYTRWLGARRVTAKGFITRDRATLHAARVFLHTVRGRQGSFMLPTFAADLTPVNPINSGSSTIDVANTGLASYNAIRESRRYIRVYGNGAPQNNEVSEAEEITADTETLTVSNSWSADHALEDISRVCFLEKVRLNADEVSILHQELNGRAEIFFPVKAVLE